MKRRYRGGYAGLVMLVVTACIVAFITWRMDLFIPKPAVTGAPSNDSVAPTTIEGQLNAIDAAKNAKQQIESRYQTLESY